MSDFDINEEANKIVRLELSGIGHYKRYKHSSFENFDVSIAGVTEAFNYATMFAGAPRGFLVLVGGYGAGKTHLLIATTKEALHVLRMNALYLPANELLSNFNRLGSSSEFAEYFKSIKECDFLALDDYGSFHDTRWAGEQLANLLDYRGKHLLPTVIASNSRLLLKDKSLATWEAFSGDNAIPQESISLIWDEDITRLIVMSGTPDYRSRSTIWIDGREGAL